MSTDHGDNRLEKNQSKVYIAAHGNVYHPKQLHSGQCCA